MNERMTALAHKAGMGRERWNTTTQFEGFLERFRQLVVQECAPFVGEHDSPAVKEFLRHFGVKP